MGWRLMPPFWFLLALVAMPVIDRLAPGVIWLGWPWILLGVVPVALGIWLASWGHRLFVEAGTTIRPGSESSALVTRGPFRVSRNPMYLGMVLVLIGVGVLLGSAWAFVVVPVFMVLLEVLFIRPEEAMMRVRFGEEFAAYRRRTRRWL